MAAAPPSFRLGSVGAIPQSPHSITVDGISVFFCMCVFIVFAFFVFILSFFRGYRGGSPTAVQAQRPCPLWELSLNHPILVQTRRFAVFCVYCLIIVCLFCLCTTGYRGGSPTAVRLSDPALCGSCPLITPYQCKLGGLLCFLCISFFVSLIVCLLGL